jgi:deazaflavin-dependent oxidoreductase (nitroreductase family)
VGVVWLDWGMAKSYHLGPSRRAINALVIGLLNVGAGPRSTYLLTTTGRRTGQPRTTPVTLVEEAGHRWLVAPYGDVGWVHNVRANPEVGLRRGRREEVLQAEETDAATAGPVLRRYLREVTITAPFFDVVPDSPDAEFVAEAPRHPVFALTRP